MAKTPGIDRRGFVAGTVALGTVGAAADIGAPAGAATPAQNSVHERTMTTATIDGLEVNYVTHGVGPALLMLARDGFDATMEGIWPLDALANDFTVIAYDQRKYQDNNACKYNGLCFMCPTDV
jgi:hypothetical protein